MASIPSVVVAATITVTTTADDLTPNDGTVSLREAITAINAGNNLGDPDIIAQNPGTFATNDTINFNISASLPIQTIHVGGTGNGALPALLVPITIDGYTELGASANTLANADNAVILIELEGSNAGPDADGLLVASTGGGSTVRGLAINRFSLNGIELQSGSNVVAGNFIGLDPQGVAAEPNENDGIRIFNSNFIRIGGATPSDRNVVSGNNNDGIHIVGSLVAPAILNLIEGNFIGVNTRGTGSIGLRANGASAGTLAGNFLYGIEISGGNLNTVGGTSAGARNVIGYNLDGIEVDDGSANNVIQGNFVGVGADGVTPVGQILHGIALRSDDNLAPPYGPGQANEPGTSGNIIGQNPTSPVAGSGNLIEFNGSAGVAVFGNPLPNNATPTQNSGNTILSNSIFQNGLANPSFLLGIDLTYAFVYPKDDGVTLNGTGHGAANDPNNLQNFPVITAITLSSTNTNVFGTMHQGVSPHTSYRIEFFANTVCSATGYGEGETFLGALNVATDGTGNSVFTIAFPREPVGSFITATATNLSADPSVPSGSVNLYNTSEFSKCVSVPSDLIFANGFD